MDKFLKDILVEKGYNLEKESLNLWGNDSEFFILKEFDKKNFLLFYKDEELNQFISDFQSIENNKIIQNTSLIILLNVDDLEVFYRNNLYKIMQIEEDEYYFRKYVVLYTNEGLSKLESNTKFLLDYIQGQDSKDRSLFDKFENNMFFEEAYFIAMQLIIKLPFISLPHANGNFEMIEDRIKLQIKKEYMIESEEKVNQILEKLDSIDIKYLLEDSAILDELNKILGDYFYEN